MYLTRAAGIETDFEYLFAFYFWKMYLTRVAGIETNIDYFACNFFRRCILPALRELKPIASTLFAASTCTMYLTRVAGMLLRLPLKAVRNANARAGHAPPLQRL